MTTKYLAFDVGCIECGENSGPIGLFDTEEEAEEALEEPRRKQAERWSGQHSFGVYPIEVE